MLHSHEEGVRNSRRVTTTSSKLIKERRPLILHFISQKVSVALFMLFEGLTFDVRGTWRAVGVLA